MKSSEYLSSDMLDESLLKAFAPFRSAQMVLGSCRVDAKYRFVTAPTTLQRAYSVFCLLTVLIFYLTILAHYFSRYVPYPHIYYLNFVSLFLHFSTFACNVIHVRFVNNDSNVKFYIKMQEIDRKLKVDNNKVINDILFKSNVMSVAAVGLVSLVLYASAVSEDLVVTVSFAGPLFAQMSSTLEWLSCSNLLIYFYIRIRYINAIITNHLKGTPDLPVDKFANNIIPSMKMLRCLASKTHDFKYSDIDIYLADIFEELLRYQSLYRFQIFLFCFKFFTITLLVFEFILLGLQQGIIKNFEFVVLPTVTAFDLIIIVVICVRCEAFYREIRTTKYLCITVLSQIYSGPLRRKAIKMLKMIKEKPPQFSVYDMWQMTASTMFKMINLVTTLMVTLLQFAVL
ncbi:uncharacterized protein LOC124544355 [Vanessa cardui]|uniref:uncharacterized protein LOC124544355 n=1 Tax=Vanessa cardui TaxID=171605 RepID=UPI001F142944|nr:uncharacterized protein LOC124544355 [Vanessa cardui]